MIKESILETLDPNVRYFVWYISRHLSPLFSTMFSCDGHGKASCYVIINPITLPLFEQFKETLADHDNITMQSEIIAGRKRWKVSIFYSNLNELYERQEYILRIGEKLCRKPSLKSISKKH